MFDGITYSKQIDTQFSPCLSIFTGPMVECSFSTMNGIIDSRSGRMEIKTYSAVMTTKYSFKCSKSAALKFNRKNILRDSVVSKLSYYMYTRLQHVIKKYLKTKRSKKLLKKKKLSSKKVFSEVRTVSRTNYFRRTGRCQNRDL